MANQRYVLIDGNGAFVNVIEYDDGLNGTDEAYVPPEGLSMVLESNFEYPPQPPLSKAELIAYANAKQWATATGGRLLSVGGQMIPFATTEASMSLISGKMLRLQQPNPPPTINWQIGPTQFAVIAAADFKAAATEVADFFQETFDALPQVFADIQSGAITTPQQIDAVLSAI